MVHYGYRSTVTDAAEHGDDRTDLAAVGCSEIIEEQASGRRTRVALAALITRLRPGDRITIGAIAHVARSVADFHRVARRIEAAGAEFCSLREEFDSGTDVGRATLRMLASLSRVEGESIAASTKQGLAAARARGEQLGRPRTLSPGAEDEIREKLERGALIKELARHYRVSPTTIRRIRANEHPADRIAGDSQS